MKASIWKGAVTGEGLFLGVPEEVYHADPCPTPSLSSSVARKALHKSLFHARAAHPRLAPVDSLEGDDDETRAANYVRDIGSAAHSLSFGVGAEVVEIETQSFTNKVAKVARDEARLAGKIPLKTKHFRIAQNMAAIAGPIMTKLLDGSCVAEAMLCWKENGLWRRGLLDRMRPDARVIIDYKTTGNSAAPEDACRALYDCNYHFQEAYYRRGLDRLDPDGRGRRRFWFFYQEQEPPHAYSLIETDEAGRTLGEEQVAAACALWDRAVRTDCWPGYPEGPVTASPMPWLLSRWADRYATDETLNPMEAA